MSTQPSLPFVISKIVPTDRKGTAMGVYASAEFFGDFCGGAGGGLAVHHFGPSSIPFFISAIGGIWFCLALFMK